jgi:hypothetical protein
MKKYSVDGTQVTPLINFDLLAGTLELRGFSIPENSIEFYKELNKAIEIYSSAPQPNTIVTVELEYVNTSSSKCLLGIFKKLETLHKSGSTVIINWLYEEDDEDMLQAGEDYQAMVNVPFKMAAVSR